MKYTVKACNLLGENRKIFLAASKAAAPQGMQ